MDLLVVLPDGRKRMIPQAWTDAEPAGTDAEMGLRRWAALGDLLGGVCAGVGAARARPGKQAAPQSPCEEDHDAACPAQSAPDPSGASGGVGRALPEPGSPRRSGCWPA